MNSRADHLVQTGGCWHGFKAVVHRFRAETRQHGNSIPPTLIRQEVIAELKEAAAGLSTPNDGIDPSAQAASVAADSRS